MRETGKQVQVIYHGKVVALLVPVEAAGDPDSEKRARDELDSLAAEIGARWPNGVSAVQAVSEARR